MTTACESLQRALHTRFSGHAPLASRISGIFDHVPVKAAFPYLLFGEARTADASTATTAAERLTLELAILSDAAGRAETLSLFDELRDALIAPLTLSGGWRCVSLRYGSAVAQTLEGGRLRRLRVTVDAIIEAV